MGVKSLVTDHESRGHDSPRSSHRVKGGRHHTACQHLNPLPQLPVLQALILGTDSSKSTSSSLLGSFSRAHGLGWDSILVKDLRRKQASPVDFQVEETTVEETEPPPVWQ